MSPRRPAAVLLAVVALVASGCGSDANADNAYVGRVQRAQAAYVADFGKVLAGLTPTSTVAQDRATLGRFATVAGSYRAQLSDITPPAKVAAEHRALVRVVAGIQQQFASARKRLAEGSPAAAATVRTMLSSSVSVDQERVAKAIGDINATLHG